MVYVINTATPIYISKFKREYGRNPTAEEITVVLIEIYENIRKLIRTTQHIITKRFFLLFVRISLSINSFSATKNIIA